MMKGPRGPLVWMVFLAIMIPSARGMAGNKKPEFSFWGNLPIAQRLLKHLPFELRFEPAPLVDPDDLAQCPVNPGETLVLIRNGKLVGRGRVGEILAGWLPRAGDDRVVFFLPEALPDSVLISKELTFPGLGEGDFDVYVVGENAVQVLEPAETNRAGDDEARRMVENAIRAGVFQPFDFQPAKWVDGVPVLPDPPEALAWLEERTDFVIQAVGVNDDFTVRVAICDPFFIRVQTADHIKPYFLRGALDYVLEIDGSCYMIMRAGKAGSGAWGYDVYLLQPNALPTRVYSDGSWST